eukprot:3969663-Pleurochrysis_carterae.AAC.1
MPCLSEREEGKQRDLAHLHGVVAFAPSWLVSSSATEIFGSCILVSAAIAITSSTSIVAGVAAALVGSLGVCASASTASYLEKRWVPSGERTCDEKGCKGT